MVLAEEQQLRWEEDDMVVVGLEVNLIVGVGKKSGDLPARAHLREHTFRYQRDRACNL